MYTSAQKEAIQTIDQNLQIIACAGSGKTEVISQRIVEILKRGNGVRPANIVAFTFTTKAAEELRARIYRLCKQQLATEQGLSEMYVGTIHGYCLQLLQQPPAYEFLKYRVLNELQQLLMIYRSPGQTGVKEVSWPKPQSKSKNRNKKKSEDSEEQEPVERSNDWEKSKLYQKLISILDEGDVKREEVPEGVLKGIDKYRKYIDEEHKKYFDYSGLLRRAVEELDGKAELQEKIRSTVRYLIVDEYQDVSPMQERLIRKITELGANLCVVGDDDQTIYQWRGSDVENILTFKERYPDVKSVTMNRNYRSSPQIVDVACSIAERIQHRLEKQMESGKTNGFEAGDLLALEFSDHKQEADWIAKKIKSMLGAAYPDKQNKAERGLALSDFSILVRSWNDTAPIAEALRKREIPFVCSGMNSLFDALEAKAMRAAFCYLSVGLPGSKLMKSKEDLRQDFLRGFPGITEAQIDRGIRFLDEVHGQLLVSPNEQGNQNLFLQQVYFGLINNLSLREESLGAANCPGEVIFSNLGKFSQLITDYEQIGYKSPHARCYERFAEFLNNHAGDFYDEETSETTEDAVDAVRITTVHQAKGMQWPVVFIPFLRRNQFPLPRRGGRNVFHIIPEDCVPRAERYRGSEEDERRLFYVALTRSEKYLFCSWAPHLEKRNQQSASDFFLEVAEHPIVLREDHCLIKDKIPENLPDSERLLQLTFSELRYYLECPYRYKLRFVYGFNAPIRREMGLGKSIHGALCEVHGRSMKGDIPQQEDAKELARRHLHLPFINVDVSEDRTIKKNLLKKSEAILQKYLGTHAVGLKGLEHTEKPIELDLKGGTHVSGRMDLIRKSESGEESVVEFKTSVNAQSSDLTRFQLYLYAAGYQDATGRLVDVIETHHLETGKVERELISQEKVDRALDEVVSIAAKIHDRKLAKHPKESGACDKCDMAALCR